MSIMRIRSLSMTDVSLHDIYLELFEVPIRSKDERTTQ